MASACVGIVVVMETGQAHLAAVRPALRDV